MVVLVNYSTVGGERIERNLLANLAFVGSLILEPGLDARFVRLGHLPSTQASQLDERLLGMLLTYPGNPDTKSKDYELHKRVPTIRLT